MSIKTANKIEASKSVNLAKLQAKINQFQIMAYDLGRDAESVEELALWLQAATSAAEQWNNMTPGTREGIIFIGMGLSDEEIQKYQLEDWNSLPIELQEDLEEHLGAYEEDVEYEAEYTAEGGYSPSEEEIAAQIQKLVNDEQYLTELAWDMPDVYEQPEAEQEVAAKRTIEDLKKPGNKYIKDLAIEDLVDEYEEEHEATTELSAEGYTAQDAAKDWNEGMSPENRQQVLDRLAEEDVASKEEISEYSTATFEQMPSWLQTAIIEVL